MRWEKERSLPVHRGPDGRSGVVFADMDELDAWTRGHKAEPESVLPAPVPFPPVARAVNRRWAIAATAAILTILVGVGGWRVRGSRADEPPASVEMTDRAVVARNADGSEKWRHEFAGVRAAPLLGRAGYPMEPLASEGVLTAIAETTSDRTRTTVGGQLIWFDPSGTVRQTFSFDDRLTFGARAYAPPWALSDFQVDGGSDQRRIAVASHHQEWWPSMVTILDHQWHRKATFVHAGWVEFVRWLPGDRVAIAGFSNLKDAGMVALLNANSIDGQSPSPPGSEFECATCGPGRPVRYVVMPRSEVNRVSAAPFNRASVLIREGALLVSTVELPHTTATAPANALYEFSPQLELVHASYSDRYWEGHRELERVGKITHTREQCPDRQGPRQIEIWEPATGWRVQMVNRLMASRRP